MFTSEWGADYRRYGCNLHLFVWIYHLLRYCFILCYRFFGKVVLHAPVYIRAERNGFTFKQFCGTRSLCNESRNGRHFIGAWAPVAGVKRILDISTGSGLLALMPDARTDENVIIDAVELDVDAAQQAQENIAQSPWMHRVNVHTEDVQQWVPRPDRAL